MFDSNHRIREQCMICEGRGSASELACAYCGGSGIVFARKGAPDEILIATGDCKVPLKRKPAQGLSLVKRFS